MTRIFATRMFAILAFCLLGFSANLAQAACSSPSAAEGNVRYDTTGKTLSFCNGTSWITLVTSCGATSNCYEAENASNERSISANGAASGGQYRGGYGNSSEFTTFTVSVPSAGTYLLDARVATGEVLTTAGIVVNGGSAIPLYINCTTLCNTGPGFTNWVNRIVAVPLNSGTNTIRIQGSTEGFFNLDKICLYKQ